MLEGLAGKIEPIEIEEEMSRSFLDYSMSVIVSRALPDVRDGLKPVHRRILFGMYELGLLPSKAYKKSARSVGDVMAKYHPHGDSAIYDTMVRMAQDFSMRYPLVDGQGNFGSVDGDSAAAMRYTESRLDKLALELLRDIDKDTVNFVPNYDGANQEPSVLPSRFPHLLVNGSGGIAVGMATNIPPHNICEIIDGAIHIIDNPDATTEDLLDIVKAPDFPTQGIIMGTQGVKDAYMTGRGSVKIRGRAVFEEAKSGKFQIVITEIPYQVNKARLLEKIVDMVKEKKIPEISNMVDLTSRSGMRVVLDLKRDVVPQVVLNKLYKHTPLETTFGVNMVALVDGAPRTLSLRDMLHYYVQHQREVVTRRTQFNLDKALARDHIVLGLLIALDNIDEVIKVIRGSQTVDEAHQGLMDKFKLSDLQARAIREMRLQSLVGLEREKLNNEHAELLKTIGYLEGLLADDVKLFSVIKEEILVIRDKFGDDRRTEVVAFEGDLDIEDLIADEEQVITITNSGYVKRIAADTYRQQRRGGRGISGLNLKEDDWVEHLFWTSTHDYILFFSTKGKVYKLKVHELPPGSRQSRGTAVVNLLPLEQDERIAAVIATREFDDDTYLLFATEKGIIKKTNFSLYNVSRRDGIIAINLKDGDRLKAVRRTTGDEKFLLVTAKGQSIVFSETDCRPMGRAAAGVKGINLDDDDLVIGADMAVENADVFVVTEAGMGKCTQVSKYPVQRRGGRGVKTISSATGSRLAGARVVLKNYELMLISSEGIVIRIPVDGISCMGRNTQGVRIMNIKGKDRVSAVARVMANEGAASISEDGTSEGQMALDEEE